MQCFKIKCLSQIHPIFFLFYFIFSTIVFAQESHLQGYWVGSIGGDLNGKVEIEYPSEEDTSLGRFQFTSPSMSYLSGFGGIIIDNLKIEFSSPLGDFEGAFSRNKKTIKGKMITQDYSLPVVFKKTEGGISESQFGFSDFGSGSDFSGMESFESVNSNFYMYLGLCLLFWILFTIYFILLIRKRIAKQVISSEEVIDDTESDWLKEILPIVRIRKKGGFFSRDRAVILHKRSILFFKKGRKRSIASLHGPHSKERILKHKGLSRHKIIPLDAVTQLRVSKPSRLGTVRYKLLATVKNKTKTYKFDLPQYETPNLNRALKSVLGDRLKLNYSIKLHYIGRLFVVVLFSLFITVISLSGGVEAYGAGSSLTDTSGWLNVVIFILLHLIILGIPITLWILDHLHLKPQKEKQEAQKDLSDRKPFRSKPLAILFKLVAVAVLLLSFLVWDLGVFLTYFIVGNVLFIAHALAQRDPNKLKAKIKKKTILYLRSFLDDRETTLNPRTPASSALGIDPPYHFLDRYGIDSGSRLYRSLTLMIRYLYNYHPFRLWKLLIGRPIDTSEQQFGNFFSKFGFFVAIGKPGEKIVTTGAARMYVGNDEWQEVVTNLMEESQFIVLQPSRTTGIWWEVEQVLQRIPPSKLLLCLVNYKERQDDYENFRIKMKTLLPDIELERGVGNENKITFLHFDEEWQPKTLSLQYNFVLFWPILGQATNLKSSLKPFLKNIK